MTDFAGKQQEELAAWHRWNDRGQQLHDPDFIFLANRLMPVMKHQAQMYRTSEVPDPAIDAELLKILTERMKKYDPSMGTQLNTHIIAGIKQVGRFVRRYMNTGRIPDDRSQRVGLYKNTVANMVDEIGRTPTDSEVADRLTWSVPQVELLRKEIRKDVNLVGFFEEMGLGNSMNVVDKLYMLRFELEPEEQKVLDHIYGFNGVTATGGSPEALARVTGLPRQKIYRITDKISRKLEKKNLF